MGHVGFRSQPGYTLSWGREGQSERSGGLGGNAPHGKEEVGIGVSLLLPVSLSSAPCQADHPSAHSSLLTCHVFFLALGCLYLSPMVSLLYQNVSSVNAETMSVSLTACILGFKTVPSTQEAFAQCLLNE